jgi:hypothetical protein
MRKNFLIYRIIFSFFILTFSSCVNHDFDLDDGKLDTNATFGDGIGLPVGNIEKISIYDKLLEVYDDTIGVGDDNVLYVEYAGTFPVNFPEFTVPEIAAGGGEQTLSMGDNPILLQGVEPFHITVGTIKDMLKKPESKEGLDLDPINILFSSCTLDISFGLLGISLIPEANNGAELIVTLTFSKKFRIKGADMVNNTTIITDTIPFGSNQPVQIEVESYTFDDNITESDLTYSVDLDPGSATSLNPNDPKFNLVINGQPKISSLECRLSGQKNFNGAIAEFRDLQNAFGDKDTLEFNNPSMTLSFETNLDAKFTMGLNLRSGTITSILNPPLPFEPPKTPSHTIDTGRLSNFREIISTPFPEKLDYTGSLIFNEEDIATLPGSVNLNATYSFKIPFDFKEISLSLKDTITDLFTEDTYDDIFSHIDDVTIEADLENSIAGTGMHIDAVILDADRKEIPGLVETKLDGTKLSIAIKDDSYGATMKNARHLAFTFRLSGVDTKIKKSDFIEIKNLRLVSSSGIRYEF